MPRPSRSPGWSFTALTGGSSRLRALRLVAPPAEGGPVVQEPGFPGADRRTDEQLAGRGSAGLDALYRRHHGAVHRYCVGVLRSPDEAADASQSAWVRALVALSATDVAVINVRPWLYAIARNECLDRLRAGREAERVDLSDLELAGGELPEEAHEAREDVRSLLGDLGTLSERQRSAIVLREFCGLDADELAETLDTTAPRALGLVADARRTLIERRSGRLLSCEIVRQELTRVRRRPVRVRAHLDACSPCQSFARRRRGRALSSLGLTPWGLVRLPGETMATIASSPVAVKGVVAAALAVGTVGVSPSFFAPPPTRPPAGAPLERTAEGDGPGGTAARGGRFARAGDDDSSSPGLSSAPAAAGRVAARTRRPSAGRRRTTPASGSGAIPGPPGDPAGVRTPLGVPPAASGHPLGAPGRSGSGSSLGVTAVAPALSAATLAPIERTTADMLPAIERVARGTLGTGGVSATLDPRSR